jgi:aminoglycoside phosphotransferase (APT) family kinase protein
VKDAPDLLHLLTAAEVPAERLESWRGGRVWRLRNDLGDWSLHRCSVADSPAQRATARWLDALHRRQPGLLPEPYPLKGGVAGFLDFGAAGGALLVRWLPGEILAEGTWDETSAKALGRLLGSLHRSSSELPWIRASRRYHGVWARGLWRRLRAEQVFPDAERAERAVVRQGLSVARQYLERAWSGGAGGPVAMVHADVHAGNLVRVGSDGLALIDFGRVGLAPLELDLAFATLEHQEATRWPLLRAYRGDTPEPQRDPLRSTAFRLLALSDNLGFLGEIDEERDFVVSQWPELLHTSAALLEGPLSPSSNLRGVH